MDSNYLLIWPVLKIRKFCLTVPARPDIVVKNGNKRTVIELSCCYETNFMKTRNYKIERYSKLWNLYVDKNFIVTKLYIEVSSLGVSPRNIQEFRNFCKQYDCIYVTRMIEKLSEVAIRSFYFIYKRNKRWENSEILKFYW